MMSRRRRDDCCQLTFSTSLRVREEAIIPSWTSERCALTRKEGNWKLTDLCFLLRVAHHFYDVCFEDSCSRPTYALMAEGSLCIASDWSQNFEPQRAMPIRALL